jgi:DNA polymerase elongation subunit (family B)
MTKLPKILYFDIETLPMLIPVFRLGDQKVTYDQILKYPVVFCISWAWNDGKVQHTTFDMKKYDINKKDDDSDFVMIRDFCKLVEDADVLVGHNAKSFDIGVLASRVVKFRLPPIAPTLIDDTYISTKPIKFVSHKLDSLADFLGYGHKSDHGKGMEYWIEVMMKNKPTLKKMVKYCDDDVKLLRKIHKHLQPYVKPVLTMSIFTGEPLTCRCGSNNVEKRGYHRTTAGKLQRFQCRDCGAWNTEGKNLIKKSGDYLR